MRKLYFLILTLAIIVTGSAQSFAQCQSIAASISSSPATDADTILRICQNETVTFTGVAEFEESAAGATYDWKMNNVGGFSTGTTFVHTFTTSGVYVVDFVPMDAEGCVSADCNSRIVVHVSPTPSFWGSSVPDSICQGVAVSLSAGGIGGGEVTTVITPDTPTFECAPPISEETFLPDGSGVSYTTSIEVTCFTACDTITDGSDILSICLNMEHSYLGDLDWKITCPSGLEATIKQYPGGYGTYLGGALDDGTTIPGVGFDYCFSDDAVWGTMLEELALGTTVIAGVPASAAMEAGTYKPFQSFDNLIGCPMNGTWTITVTDHLSIDNGYIFGWGIEFNTDAVESYSFNTDIVSYSWSGPSEIVVGDPTILIPEDAGVACYTLTAMDNFGCTYDTTMCTFVKEFPSPGADTSISVCPSLGSINLFDYLGGTPEIGGFWTGPGITVTGVLNTEMVPPGLHTYTYNISNTFCDTQATVTVLIENEFGIDFVFDIFKGCTEDTVIFTPISEDTLTHFRWNFADGSPYDTTNYIATHIYEDQDVYNVWFVGVNTKGCVDSVMKAVDVTHPLEATFTQSNDSVCQSTESNVVYFFDASIGNVQSWEWDFGDGNTSTLQNPVHTYSLAGTHTIRLIITDDIPCSDTIYSTIYVDSTPDIRLSVAPDEICGGDQVTLTVDYFESTENMTWNFGDGSIISDVQFQYEHSYPTPGVYYPSVTTFHPVCPPVSAIDTVTVKPYPQINLGPDTMLCLKGQPIVMNPTTTVSNPPGTVYYWSNGDTSSVLKITEPGTYWVSANLDGCVTTDFFDVNKDCYTDVPNSFTPNGDGINDYFYPRQLLSKGIVDFTLTIYNRWGEKIFETSNPDGRGWDGKFDGKDQPMGVYVYQISVRYKNQASEQYTGNVTLIR